MSAERLLSRRTFLYSSAMAVASSCLSPGAVRTTASSTDWPAHGWDIRQTRHNAAETSFNPDRVARLTLRWSFEAGSGITGTPAVVGDRVFVGSWDGYIYALDRLSGALLWRFDAGVRVYEANSSGPGGASRRLGVFASPAVLDGKVFAVSDRVLALDARTGRLLWERTIGRPERSGEYFWAPPLVFGKRLYAGVSGGGEARCRGRIVCLDVDTSAILWSFFTVPPAVSGGGLIAPPSLDTATGTLYAATGNPYRLLDGPLEYSCSLIALDARSGTLRWADQVHPHDGRNLDLNCPPMLVSAVDTNGHHIDLVIVGGKDGIRAWNRKTRQQLWHVQLAPALPPRGATALPTTGPEGGPTAAAGALVFFASNKHVEGVSVLAAIEAASGNVRWSRRLQAFEFAPMSVAGGVVFMGLTDGRLRAWRADNGDLIWTSPELQPIAGGVAIAGDAIFVGTGAGQFLPGNKLLSFTPR